MRKSLLVLLAILPAALFPGCANKSQELKSTQVDLVARGQYLVNTGLCHDCHTPKVFTAQGEPVPDSTRLLAGHPAGLPHPEWTPADLQKRNIIITGSSMLTAWAGPWGVSFATNLTPDTSTGIGEWTEESFIRTLRSGKHQGYPNGRDILPPMPWQFIGQKSDDDLKAIWAYLRSLPPVTNQVPLPVPPVRTVSMAQ
ncbi:MAG: diheme cytochrome c-553 [candidate division KSB1 bacterium]|nr:diheme cytochrome c-553 [candidate division KSB1 bacterium]MDZ7274141.1 diheme cytochrome c-553 [candidate division KSB1 bacterium]MDZ7287814.1 diheme cytochrome c-553 [candidate division KSB1 bacterium]MDZ7296740.1 diheme cytochrome c-553 [candidate division KSB1 bacterium]MDZ7347606.1 diheme cytochrome c-553 [candidate division KSB1 bacterium]